MIQKNCRRSFLLDGPEDTHKSMGERSQHGLVSPQQRNRGSARGIGGRSALQSIIMWQPYLDVIRQKCS